MISNSQQVQYKRMKSGKKNQFRKIIQKKERNTNKAE